MKPYYETGDVTNGLEYATVWYEVRVSFIAKRMWVSPNLAGRGSASIGRPFGYLASAPSGDGPMILGTASDPTQPSWSERRRRAGQSGIAILGLCAMMLIAHRSGLRVNLTSSQPIGLYRLDAASGILQNGDRVLVCPLAKVCFSSPWSEAIYRRAIAMGVWRPC